MLSKIFNYSRLYSNRLQTRIINKKYTQNELIENFIIYPAKNIGKFGAVYGAFEGFKMSKEEIFFTNMTCTIGGSSIGFFVGCGLGMFWPFSIPVAIGRYIYTPKT